jgi:hypothetical protein
MDESALAPLLNLDPRVQRVGRRLYARVGLCARGSLRIVGLIRDALESRPHPWSHRDLVDYVRQRRDFASGQIEGYLRHIAGLVEYSRHVVGIRPIDRGVMLALLGTEDYVHDRLSAHHGGRATTEELWEDCAGDDDHLSSDERAALLARAEHWRRVKVKGSDPIVFAEAR